METVAKIYLYKDDPKRDWACGGQAAENGGFVCLVQGEGGAEQLEFHLMLDLQTPLDLTGKTVTFYLTKPDGQQIYLPAVIPDGGAAPGAALAALTVQCTAASGIAKHGEVRVTGSDGGVIKFPAPDFYISASETESAVESRPEFHALDAALAKTESTLSESQTALASAQDVLNSDRQAVTDASSAASDAAQKAQAAGAAAASAADAASTANAAAQNASSAAQAANSAASACNSAASDLSSAVAAQISAQKDIAGGIASYDAFQSHKTNLNNPHGVTALQIGVCRPNLLTDGNIRVWQESESFTGLTGNRYTATMWQTWQTTGASYSVQKAGACGGILVKNDSADAISVSLVALVEKGTVKPGSVYTVSAKGTRNGSVFTVFLADYGDGPFAYKILTEADPSFSFTTPSALDSHFFVSIEISGLAAGSSAEIDSIKLEEGGNFTGFYTEQYADVFARTLRYYQRGFDGRALTLASPCTGTASMFIPLFQPMRAAPAVSVISGSNLTECIGANWDANVTPTNLRCLSSKSGGFLLVFDNATLNKQYFIQTDVIQADARM